MLSLRSGGIRTEGLGGWCHLQTPAALPPPPSPLLLLQSCFQSCLSLGSVIQGDQPSPIAWGFQFRNWETPGQTGTVGYPTNGFLVAKFNDASQSLTILTSRLLLTPGSSLIPSLLLALVLTPGLHILLLCQPFPRPIWSCHLGSPDYYMLGSRDIKTKGWRLASGKPSKEDRHGSPMYWETRSERGPSD